MIILLLLSVIFVDSGDATTNCLELHNQQLAALNERMNQMLNSLYSSPLISKLLSANPKSTSSLIEKEEPPHQESCYHTPSTVSTPAPSIICVAPPPPSPSAGTLVAVAPSNIPSGYYPPLPPRTPVEYTYPGIPISWPNYYDYSYYNSLNTQYPPYPSNSYYPYNYPPKFEYAPPLYPASYSPPTPQYTAPFVPPPAPYYPAHTYLP